MHEDLNRQMGGERRAQHRNERRITVGDRILHHADAEAWAKRSYLRELIVSAQRKGRAKLVTAAEGFSARSADRRIVMGG